MRWKWGWRRMRVKWTWKWDEGFLRRTQRGGTQNKREGENTNTNTPGPERANPEKAREKKSGGRRRRAKTSGGGEGRKRLNQPTTAKPKPTLARSGPNLPNKGSTHELRNQRGPSWWKQQKQLGFNSKMQRSRVTPWKGTWSVYPGGHVTAVRIFTE